MDYGAVNVTVDPRDGDVTVPILLDDIMEGVESFQLMLIIPDTATNVLPGDFTTANVFISDLDGKPIGSQPLCSLTYSMWTYCNLRASTKTMYCFSPGM